MPFDQELYDGIFSYSLIHVLNAEGRIKLIDACYNQLRPDGHMVFRSISNTDFRYGEGEEISPDTFEKNNGVTLFFYVFDSIEVGFRNYGLIDVREINEPKKLWVINPHKDFGVSSAKNRHNKMKVAHP